MSSEWPLPPGGWDVASLTSLFASDPEQLGEGIPKPLSQSRRIDVHAGLPEASRLSVWSTAR